jgi:hypothetical protein
VEHRALKSQAPQHLTMSISGTKFEAPPVAHQRISPRRLLPQIIDTNAAVHPTKLYAIFPKTESIADGIVHYDYKQLANAINHVAGYLDTNLPKSVDFDTFAYIGSKDIRYSILAMAALKMRRKVRRSFLISLVLDQNQPCRTRFSFRRPLDQWTASCTFSE